jgi:iron(III) transport system substrate-binding protein
MTAQAVEKINGGNNELEILFFEEGSPYSLYGSSVVKGKETRTEVMEVMDYIVSSYIAESCEAFYPEQIYKDVQFEKPNFPKNIIYSNMDNNTLKQKENLLKKWKY